MTLAKFPFIRHAALLAALLLTLNVSNAHAEDADGFTPLFDGKSIDGWVQHGGKAKYTVEKGVVVGTSVPNTPNSFLCTPRDYSDFVLELEFKVDPPLNSGVQIRSQVFDMPRAIKVKNGNKTKTIKVAAGRVHGYQVEIDPSARAWSGGIYDEGRRGWLNNLEGDKHKKARAAFKQNEWNHYLIVAEGDSIKTWINGVPAADLKDDLTPSGFIALQVHGVGKDASKVGKQVRWRNIKIREIKKAE